MGYEACEVYGTYVVDWKQFILLFILRIVPIHIFGPFEDHFELHFTMRTIKFRCGLPIPVFFHLIY